MQRLSEHKSRWQLVHKQQNVNGGSVTVTSPNQHALLQFFLNLLKIRMAHKSKQEIVQQLRFAALPSDFNCSFPQFPNKSNRLNANSDSTSSSTSVKLQCESCSNF